jgi:DNA (cytosine-5)-methyltransferase 1
MFLHWMPKQKESTKVVSLFSGCGGLDLPFHQLGFETVWANDNNEWACKTFARNIAPVISCEAIEKADFASVPDADVVIGGFPCQDFSVIWKRKGLEAERGNLYTFLLKMVAEKQPKAFVAENVKGLLSANNSEAIKRIIEDFEGLMPGYIVKPKLYNFADYGVPQFRERVIIVGIRKDTGFDFHHPAPTHGPGRDFPHFTAGKALEGVEAIQSNNEIMKIHDRTRDIIDFIGPGGNFTDIPKENPLYVKGMISHVYRRIDPDRPSTTIIAGGGGGTWGYHYPDPRPLTNRERARIQTFPDDFIFDGSITEVRRQIGNAVPPRGAMPIVRALLPLFEGKFNPVDLQAQSECLRKMPVRERLRRATDESIKLPLFTLDAVHQ